MSKNRDPNIWWSNRSLRKRTYKDSEGVGWQAGGGGKVYIPTAFFLVDELQNRIVDEALNPIYGIGLVEMEP